VSTLLKECIGEVLVVLWGPFFFEKLHFLTQRTRIGLIISSSCFDICRGGKRHLGHQSGREGTCRPLLGNNKTEDGGCLMIPPPLTGWWGGIAEHLSSSYIKLSALLYAEPSDTGIHYTEAHHNEHVAYYEDSAHTNSTGVLSPLKPTDKTNKKHNEISEPGLHQPN
jgi:hypothetical protein